MVYRWGVRAILLLSVLSLLAGLSPAWASNLGVLVSVNPNASDLPSGTPPLAALADLPCTDVNAYHVSSREEVIAALAYPSHGRPRILSDDAGDVGHNQTKDWIVRACEAGEHYEHFDGPVGPAAMSAQAIDALEDFPPESRDVLAFIRDESCASDLEAGGVLSRQGTELLWNGEPVSLVGHSWMGALVGRNVDVEGFLDVLAAHRVNLTRVWVVEQWTALAVDAPGAPRFDNAVLPFAGDLAEGTVDLGAVAREYLDRLRAFVRAASERGIVVQLTLFDRHGLLNGRERWGAWRGSPYNRDNNAGDLFAAGPAGKAPPDFVELCRPALTERAPGDCPVQAVHFELVHRLRDAVAGAGNVILEVMNEPVAEEWGEEPVVDFHRWVAAVAAGGCPESTP